MYSRKLKALKKKSKTGIKGNDGGSNWGPRLALYEREQAKEQQQYKQQQIYPHGHPAQQHHISSSSSSGVSSSNHYGHQQQNPRRQHQENNDESSSSVLRHPHDPSSHHHHHHYKTTTSQASSSTDVTKTKLTTGETGNLSKPLSVIIPPQPPSELFLPSSDFGPDRESLPSTKTWRSSSPEKSQQQLENQIQVQVHLPPVSLSSNSKPAGLLVESDGPKEVGEKNTNDNNSAEKKKTKPVVDGSKLVRQNSSDQLLEQVDKNEEIDPRKSQSAKIAALKQGLAMIYVPMEQAATRKKSAQEAVTAGVEEILHNNEVICSTTSSPDCSPKSDKQKDINNKKEDGKDADGDSLLESFDSVIFKPRSLSTAVPNSTTASSSSSGTSSNTSSPRTAPSTSNKKSPINSHHSPSSHHPKQQISESPPPLPPLNDSMKPPLKKMDKNLRFSEQLANIGLKTNCKPMLGKKVPAPTAPTHHYHHQQQRQLTSSQTSQKEAQSEVAEVKNKQQFTCHSSTSRDDTVLSCGHVKTASNYSTLSSITSSLTDEEGLQERQQSNGRGDTRSAIQQLRDLSMLIGGSFHDPSLNEQNKLSSSNNNKSKRRDSQESSGTDSGKGSGASGQSPMMMFMENNNNSPKEKMKLLAAQMNYRHPQPPPNSCVFGKGDCDDCFMVFKNPLALSSDNSSHSAGTSPLSCSRGGDPCENHHRHHHLIIQEQSKLLKQSIGKNPSSHSSSSSHTSGQASSNGSKKPKKSKKHKKTHELVFEYCDCRHCDCRHKPPDQQQQQLPELHRQRQVAFYRDSPSHSSPTSSSSPDSHHVHQQGNTTANTNGNNNNNNLFTIDEEEIADVMEFNAKNQTSPQQSQPTNLLDVTIKEFNCLDDGKEPHWHPKCWLAPDPTMGWSDLESLYSQNIKLEKPLDINDECWTCWREVAEHKKLTGTDSNRTIDRTKRMFIWLNKRHKEFNAPWWEAKKQASIRWLITKAFAHLPKEAIGDPFKESKKHGKPKYRLKDEAIKGMVNGKLYCLVLDHLYQNQHYRSRGLTHWDIIKILSRRGVYVAQPSDMKLTEGTLRQRKPLRIAAHIALIEAIMSLYCKETLSRDRVIATLNSFGQTVDPDISTAEEVLIAWINASILTLKSYILSNNKSQKLPCGRLNRWLNVPQVQEIRDLCDGIGICSLFALYCSSDLQVSEIAVPEPNDMLNIYETIANHSIIERLCHELFPQRIYHLRITDFLYIHGYMKQNILSFLVDLFHHLEINPIIRVNRLTHVPVRVDL